MFFGDNMACPNPFDALRMKVEDLGPTLYTRASWKDPWLTLVPRDEYPHGAGLSRSAFTVQRSEPNNDEEQWAILTTINSGPTGDTGAQGTSACTNTWNDTVVGYLEKQYGPEVFSLRGPLVCQDELVLHWQSEQFWELYFQAMEKRSMKSLHNRHANVYMNFVPAAGCTSTLAWTDPLHFTSQSASVLVAPQSVDLSGITTPTSALTQAHLDSTAVLLNEEGATDPNSNGWIQLGPEGPVYPLLIGQEASAQILINNADFRLDVRSGWDTFADANPLLKRRGASLVIKNFRHVVTTTPPRWDYVTTSNDGSGLAISVAHPYTEPTSGIAITAAGFIRRPAFTKTNNSKYATKGYSSETNADWRNAGYEGAIVLTPWAVHEEILRPIGAMGSMKWTPKNYMGEWQFVTGNDAMINTTDSCTGVTDPLHKNGRHFAEYRHAYKPIFPQYGRLLVFKRCPNTLSIVSC